MIATRKVLSLALLVGGWSLWQPAAAEARPHPAGHQKFHSFLSARQTQEFSPDLGFGSLPLPLPVDQIRQFDRRVRQHPLPPPIPPGLLRNFFSPLAQYRRAFALELLRERALASPSHVAFGVFFSPPNGTPYFPVRPVNVFNYLPVFRVLNLTF